MHYAPLSISRTSKFARTWVLVFSALLLALSPVRASIAATFDTIGSNPAAHGANLTTQAGFDVGPGPSGRIPLMDFSTNQTVHLQSFTVLGGIPGMSQADLANTNWKLFVGAGMSLANIATTDNTLLNLSNYYHANISVAPVVGGTYTSGGTQHQMYSITATFNNLTFDAGNYAIGFFQDLNNTNQPQFFRQVSSTYNGSSSNDGVTFGETYVVQGSTSSGNFNTSSITNFPTGIEGAYTIIFTTPDPLPTWRAMHGLAANGAQDLQNPAQDGVANLLKYAFHMAPTAGTLTTPNVAVLTPTGQAGLPLITRHTNGQLMVTYLRRKASCNPGITYQVQTAADLTNFSPLSETSATITSIDATWERVQVTDPTITPKRFARVQVTRQ